jgi:D-glycero-D-manno-heptose 1,7-bisphosphate phosphatase
MPAGEYVERWEQFEFLPGVVDAMRLLAAARIRVVIVTNQRGVALGKMSIEDVDEIHRRMVAELATNGVMCDAVLVCPHEEGACDCRKPGVGLFLKARALMPEIEFETSVVIGDSASDVLAGNRLGCASFLVGGKERVAQVRAEGPTLQVECCGASLLEVATRCLGLSPCV